MIWQTPTISTASQLRKAEQATVEFPHNAATWLVLAEALTSTGRLTEAADRLSRAAALHTESPQIHISWARTLFTLGRFEDSLAALNVALRVSPQSKEALSLRLRLLVKTSAQDVEGAAIGAMDSAPAVAELLEYRSRSSDAKDVLDFCNFILAQHPGHTSAIYYRALSLVRLGRFDDARTAASLADFITTEELAVPPGFLDGEDFRTVLKQEISLTPTLTRDPRGVATRSGMQTLAMSRQDGPAIQALIKEIEASVDKYEERFSDSSHRFMTNRPITAWINFWAVVLGEHGHQLSHIHPRGWLSGVYYVASPQKADGTRPGSLLVGMLGRNDPAPPWETIVVEPRPGRLVLFPSFLPHGTLPTQIIGQRISVAFDVVPVHSGTAGI